MKFDYMPKFDGYILRKIATVSLEVYAKLINKKFFCRNLKGDSFYNTVVNSDMSVSCNCNDKYGLGKIGNIEKQNLQEIFLGKKAKEFRRLLSNGKLPIINCSFCPDLCLVDKDKAKKYLKDFKTPSGIMIENTVNCNLNCISCDRKGIYSLRKKRSLSLKDIEKISKEVKENKIKKICYFNLGEPFLSRNIKEELEIIRKYNPKTQIAISTNGIFIDNNEKRKAALLTDEIIFSIHGSSQKSLTRYQKNGDFNRAYFNMEELIKFRNKNKKIKPLIKWKYVLFRWNDSKKLILNAIKLAKEADADEIFFEKTLSPPWGISYKYYFGLGYLNKISNFRRKICSIKLK